MPTAIASSLSAAWEQLLQQLEHTVGKRPADLNAVLFLIGLQEVGKGPRRFSKEQKQDLLHVAVCTVLAPSGYYTPTGPDKDNWPQFELANPLPPGDILAQEDFLKKHIIQYFDSISFS